MDVQRDSAFKIETENKSNNESDDFFEMIEGGDDGAAGEGRQMDTSCEGTTTFQEKVTNVVNLALPAIFCTIFMFV